MPDSRKSPDEPLHDPYILGAQDSAALKRLLSLFKKTTPASLSEANQLCPTDSGLRAKAYTIRVARCRRVDYLPLEIFGEAAWDVLLELYIARGYRSLSQARLADCTKIPLTTLLRWVKYLTDQGIVSSSKSSTDARSRVVELTPKGFAMMTSVLRAMPTITD